MGMGDDFSAVYLAIPDLPSAKETRKQRNKQLKINSGALEIMAASRVIPFRLALARCMPSEINNAAKLQVKLSEFDSNLNMHFSKLETVYAHDPDKKCQPGMWYSSKPSRAN